MRQMHRLSGVALLTCLLASGCTDSSGDTDDVADTGNTGESTASTDEAGTTMGTEDGTSGTSTTTGTGGEAECSAADQCMLVNDCCQCSAAPVGEEQPPCEQNCLQPSCDGLLGAGVAAADCRLGQCVLAPLSCNTNEVLCDILEPPPCEGGLVRSVVDGCYGSCVSPTLCATLPFACDASTCGAGWFCVQSQSGAPSLCAPLPAGCGDSPSCGCVGGFFAEVCNGGCSEASFGLLCEDGG